jgi:hypothetical protein
LAKEEAIPRRPLSYTTSLYPKLECVAQIMSPIALITAADHDKRTFPLDNDRTAEVEPVVSITADDEEYDVASLIV